MTVASELLAGHEAVWDVLRSRSDTWLRGNAGPDGHLAALTRQNDVTTIYTRDRGFRRCEGIRVENPLE